MVNFSTGSHIANQTAYPSCLQQIWPGKIQRERRQVTWCLSSFSWGGAPRERREADAGPQLAAHPPRPRSFRRCFHGALGAVAAASSCDRVCVVCKAWRHHLVFTERSACPCCSAWLLDPDCFCHRHSVKCEFWGVTLTAFCLSVPLCDIAVRIAVVGAMPAS